MARVALDRLTKIFPGPRGAQVRALEDLSLTVESGEFLVLVGPSGSGKTTTLRLIAGLDEATRGTVSIDGQVLNGLPPQDRDIAMVFQNSALYPHMSARENMAFGLKLRQFPRAEIRQRVEAAAAMLGLDGCLERKPQELSGGQRQRVALGRALVRQPKVFLFDEPLANLDPQLRLQLRAELSRLHTRLAATMIYVTHDQVEAMTLGDRIAVMKDGLLQQAADPMQLYQRPANLFVAGFIGSPPMNFFRGTLASDGGALFFREQAGNVATSPGPFALRLEAETAARLQEHIGRNVVLGLRPEAIRARLPTDAAAPPDIEAVVEVVEPLGSETWLHLRRGAQTFVARFPTTAPVRVNEKLALVFETRAAHFFDVNTGMALSSFDSAGFAQS
jgi:multiple sugar transport system ATP-binding protein